MLGKIAHFTFKEKFHFIETLEKKLIDLHRKDVTNFSATEAVGHFPIKYFTDYFFVCNCFTGLALSTMSG